MGRLVQYLDQRLYGSYCDNWDNWAFREVLLQHMQADHTVLDLGAGAGIVEATRFGGTANHVVAKICGVDPDERVAENPYLDEGRVGFGEEIPYDDDTFDLVFSCNVLEHLENPVTVFQEVGRVLKPGGMFISKTPNFYHYVPLLANLTPHWFHQWYNHLRGRDQHDTFPTRYLAKSPRAIDKIADGAGLEVVESQLIEGRPEYLRVNPVFYLCGWAYERSVNNLSFLRSLRGVLIAQLRKPSASSSRVDLPRAA